VLDGWSLQIFVRELGLLYSAFTREEPSPLPEPVWQYADFAAWQRDESHGETFASMVEYWRMHLEGAPSVLSLPLDHPRPSARTFGGAVESVTVPPQLAQRITALGRSEGATVFMAMLAAFQLLLSRLAGEEDVVVGIPIAGRVRVETEAMLGCFLNTLPLRTKFGGVQSFRELLRRVRAASMDVYAHQNVPFDLLVEKLRPKRSLSHAPFFQVLFNMLNMPGSSDELPGLRVVRRSEGEAMAKFDLTVYLEELPEGIKLRLVYSTDLFSARRAAGILSQYTQLLAQVVTDPDAPIGSYSLVSPEHSRLLPDPAAPLSAGWAGSVPEIFSRHARWTPHALAVMDGSDGWTYCELDERSNRLAQYLRELGAGPGETVAIHAQRSGSLVWALMSVLKTGAAFVILDRAYPTKRLVDYVDAARPRILLTLAEAGELPSEMRRCVAAVGGVVCDLPRFTQTDAATIWRDYPVTAPDVTIGPDDTAYIAFTSGTTGKPKGIVGRHGSLTHFTSWIGSEFGIRAADRFSMLSGLAHDPLHRDVFTPLQLGACICVPDPDAIYEPDRLAEWVRDARVTVTHLTPAMGQLLSSSRRADLDGLRVAFFVGDALTRRDVARLHAMAPHVEVINYYGTTETQRAVSYHRVTREAMRIDQAGGTEDRVREVIPLGRGTPDVQLLVVTPSGALAGVGEVGEVYTRSPHIAKGYLNDESLTADRFVPNPITRDPADRCYRTGDLGRYDLNGEVVALGRADTQLKIRGFRIELAEVEALLGRHPSVRDCVVAAHTDARGETELAAYVVGNGEAPDLSELRASLRERLPSYMQVSSFTVLESMPLTPNGKVDRRALPAAATEDTRSADSEWRRRPRNRVEEELANVWQEMLNVSYVGYDDDFFELGGHSLLAVAMMERVATIFDSRPPLSVLFEEPTIHHLAKVLVANAGFIEPRAVCIQAGEANRAPFFLFHGDYMAAGLYTRKLVKHLDANLPVYVLAPHQPGGPETIEEMAADALPCIREIQPRGPYLLGGYCNGGVVAVEVAQQLMTSGEPVDFLCVIDVDARNVQLAGLYGLICRITGLVGMDRRKQLDIFLRIHEPALRFVEEELPPIDKSSGFTERVVFAGALASLVTRRALRRLWRAVLQLAERNGRSAGTQNPVPVEAPPDERIRRARSAYITRAMLGYIPRSYAGRMTVIGAQGGRIGGADDQFRHWLATGARVDRFMIPGDHGTIVTSDIGGLGSVLRAQMPRPRGVGLSG
jgi:amino acid adenylation domain-containing protein